MRAEFHPLAKVELLEIADYIEERRTGYGRRFLDAFDRARDYLLMYPKGAPRTTWRRTPQRDPPFQARHHLPRLRRRDLHRRDCTPSPKAFLGRTPSPLESPE